MIDSLTLVDTEGSNETFKRKPTWTCGYYEVTVRGKPVKRVTLILQDPVTHVILRTSTTQDQSEYIEVNGLTDDNVSKEPKN